MLQKQPAAICSYDLNVVPDKITIHDATQVTEIRVPNLDEKVADDSKFMQSFKCTVDDSKFIFLNESNAPPSNQTIECGPNTTALNGKFACDTCGRPFLSFVELKQHKLNVHDSERKFNCSLCPKTFKGISGLKQHICSHMFRVQLFSMQQCRRFWSYC